MELMVVIFVNLLGWGMTSSGLMPPFDPLSQTNDTHTHTLWFPVTVLIWPAICAGWLIFEIEPNAALQHQTMQIIFVLHYLI